MLKTKANIRRIRETMGLTQEDIAEMYGVQLRSARRWEDPKATSNNMPDAVWENLVQLYEKFWDEADWASQKLLEMGEANDSGEIVVIYYRRQSDLDEVQGDRGRLVGYVNALTRQASFLCEFAGIDVTARYYSAPEDDGEGVQAFVVVDTFK